MAKWIRDPENIFIKKRKMTDGDHIQLLGPDASKINDYDERVYTSLKELKSLNIKFFWVLMLAIALAIMAYFNVIKSLSSNGVEIAPSIFDNVALLALSIAATGYSVSYFKFSFCASWFSKRIKEGSPKEKANALLLYPEAYIYMLFLPVNVGNPPHILSNRKTWALWLFLLLVIIAVIIYLIGFVALWIAMAIEVWSSTLLSPYISYTTVIVSAISLMLGWISPYNNNQGIEYTHHGLINLLDKQTEEKQKQTHQKIAAARIRMGLND